MWLSCAVLGLTPENRQELEHLVRLGKTEQRIALRARIVLGAADGQSNTALTKALKTSRPTVLDWRQRFAAGGVSRRLPRAKEAEIIATTQRAPTHATQWSCRKPHLIKTFKVSNDPDFIEKLEDVMWSGSI